MANARTLERTARGAARNDAQLDELLLNALAQRAEEEGEAWLVELLGSQCARHSARHLGPVLARELSLEFVNLDTRARARRPAVGALDREGRALRSRVIVDELIGQLGRAAHRLGTPQLRGEREIT